MGWFELLALMKRVLPLLSRLAPMLETYVAARGATRGDSEALEKLSEDVSSIKLHTVAEAQNRIDIQAALDAQGNHILKLGDDLQRLRTADAETIARLQGIERQNASNTILLRALSVVTITLLLACVCLLIVLVRRS